MAEAATEVKEDVVSSEVIVTEDVVDNGSPAPVKLSDTEQKALQLGWKPKEDYEGDPDEWVSAREFIRRGELFGRINEYKHEIQNLRKGMEALQKHNQKMFEQDYKTQVKTLKEAKKEALRDGDTETVLQIEDRLEQVDQEYQTKKEEFEKEVAVPVQATNQPHPAWNPWVEQNSWYSSDTALRGYADGIAAEIVQSAQQAGTQVDFTKLLQEVSRKVKQKFPEKFGTIERGKRTVERDTGEGKQKATGLTAELREIEGSLSEGEKEIMKTLIRNKTMTKEQYLQQIDAYNKRKGR